MVEAPADVLPDEGSRSRALGPDGRQARITELVLSSGSVSAQELAETFAVSVMTIHRDLDELQRQGVLRKARGVATAQPSGIFESNAEFRAKANVEAKREIARHACRHVEPGMSVLLDDSTTATQMLPHLATLAPLTVATNYLTALGELARLRDVQVVALGGHYDARHDSFLGTTCVETIRSMRFDVAFVSTSAVAEGYAFHQEDGIVAVKREMVAVAARTHLLIDHSKLTRSALHRLLPLHRFASVIVDPATPARDLAVLRENDVRVEVAGRES
ncbi:DeoR/GlpR family DNA-binding transcription regulator [Pseudonocardia nigra]|uniref:DeoR/GlpR family DNA-binding transcription regulator n=1 Tax=Pseudonocardia nigra TaxID=1921578 RepID=UPI0027E28047|nr:DeoR/GlpR family DNA-binding transcription regulator [Pseudonocardia nigra]